MRKLYDRGVTVHYGSYYRVDLNKYAGKGLSGAILNSFFLPGTTTILFGSHANGINGIRENKKT